MSEQTRRPSLSETDAVAWTGLFAGPFVWFLSQQIAYALVPWACGVGSELAIHLTNVAALAVVAWAARLGRRDWRRAVVAISDGSATSAGRARFLAMLGLMLSALFGLVILVQAMGAVVFEPCQR